MIAPMTNIDTQQPAALTTCDAGRRVGGAPLDNRSAMRHGLRSPRWPAGCERQQRENNNLRRALEDLVLSVRGELTVIDSAKINSVCEYEKVRQLASRWLRIEFDNLKAGERLNYLRESARATTERNKAIEALKIDQPSADFWNGTLSIDSLASGLGSNRDAADATKPDVSTVAAPSRNAEGAILDDQISPTTANVASVLVGPVIIGPIVDPPQPINEATNV
jgi:hypothetical protein